MENYRIIVTGSRNFENYKMVADTLSALTETLTGENIAVISGDCPGTDRLGERYAYEMDWDIFQFRTLGNPSGKNALHTRNKKMIAYATEENCHGILLSFWDGKSRGTKDIIMQALKRGMTAYIYDLCGNEIPKEAYAIVL